MTIAVRKGLDINTKKSRVDTLLNVHEDAMHDGFLSPSGVACVVHFGSLPFLFLCIQPVLYSNGAVHSILTLFASFLCEHMISLPFLVVVVVGGVGDVPLLAR